MIIFVRFDSENGLAFQLKDRDKLSPLLSPNTGLLSFAELSAEQNKIVLLTHIIALVEVQLAVGRPLTQVLRIIIYYSY